MAKRAVTDAIAKIEADILDTIEIGEQPAPLQAKFAARAHLLWLNGDGAAAREDTPKRGRKRKGLPAAAEEV
jgi:hypothetical protein